MTSNRSSSSSSANISKRLAYLLRHGAVKEGVPVGDDGYLLVSDVLTWLSRPNSSKATSIDMLREIVSTDTKGRYNLLDDPPRIRANQGHSMVLPHEIAYEPLPDDVSTVLHCSYVENMESIMTTGLSRMSRRYIHMIRLTDSWHLVRKDSTLFVYINVIHAQELGLKFYLSDNGVVLCPDVIPPECLTFSQVDPVGFDRQ